MGSQQLLMIVVGLIIVGIGVAIGINIFGVNAQQANRDAITEDCLHLAAAAQGYYRKPDILGGGNNSFADIGVTDCGMLPFGDGRTAQNMNATYVIEEKQSTLTIKGSSRSESSRIVVLVCDMRRPRDERVSLTYEGW